MTTDIRTTSNDTYRQWLIDEPQRAVDQARQEAAALAGEFGVERQLRAMSAQYLALKAAGELEAAAAVKARAYEIHAAAQH